MTTQPSENLRDRQRAETRRRLFDAAMTVFRKDGFQACRIDDIARLAEVSRAAFYFHFPSKDDVLAEFIETSQRAIVEALKALPENTPLERVVFECGAGLTNLWTMERSLLVDSVAVGFRRTAESGLRAEIARRFGLAAQRGELSKAMQPSALADYYVFQCMSLLGTWALSHPVNESPAELMRAANQVFLKGASTKS